MHASEVKGRRLNSWWVWSDTHLGHQNIVKFQQRPVNHEVIMLSNWIERVHEDDVILHLGDVFMGKGGNGKRWASVVSRMPGRKLLVLGNHDKSKPSLYEEAGFEIVDPFIADVLGRRVAFTHYPLSDAYHGGPADDREKRAWTPADWQVNVHGHVHLNAHRTVDGSLLAGRTYVNVSVEAIDFAPRQIGSLV